MLDDRRRNALFALLGGVFWALVPVLDDVIPGFVAVAVVAPVLLLFGVVELHDRYGDVYGSTGRAGNLLLGVGLVLGTIAAVAWVTLAGGLVTIFVVGLPALTGAVAVAVGSGLLAYALVAAESIPRSLAVAFALALPASPLVNAVLTPLLSVGVGTYGLAWVAMSVHLWQTGGTESGPFEEPSTATASTLPRTGAAHRVVAGLAGVVLLVAGVASFVTLDPISGQPYVGQPTLGAWYLLSGVAGVVAGAGDHPSAARRYAQVVGVAYLLLVGFVIVSMSAGPFGTGMAGVIQDALRPNLTDAFFYLPVGLVLVVVGFGVDTNGADSGDPSVE